MIKRFQSVLLMVLMGSLMFTPVVLAKGAYDLKKLTPEVKAALDSRRANFAVVEGLKAQNVVGENNQGYLTVLMEGKNAEGIVEQENSDRRVIYETIAKQHGIEDQLSVIEQTFAQVQRDEAEPGEKIQDPAGNWIDK